MQSPWNKSNPGRAANTKVRRDRSRRCCSSFDRLLEPAATGRGGGRAGFSIVEVLLSAAILLGSIVVIGELIGIGRKHAEAARERATAQLLCQSKMNEILCGLAPLEPVEGEMLAPGPTGSSVDQQQTTLEPAAGDATESDLTEEEPVWWYSVELLGSAGPGLNVVRVTVWKAAQPDDPPRYTYSMVRWVRATAGPASEEVSSWEEGF